MKKLALFSALFANPAAAHVSGELHGHPENAALYGAALLIAATILGAVAVRHAVKVRK